MKERIVLVVYRPHEGKEKALENLVSRHLTVLLDQSLVTDRKPMVMKTADGCVVEVFEWLSAQAIEKAHHNPAVQALWAEFAEVCAYEKPVNVAEFHNLFSEFTPIQSIGN
jgi:hypothetical protein